MGSWIGYASRFASVGAAVITVSIPVAAQESCAALKAMSQATDAFASLRSERLPSGRWRAKFIPAGFKDCTVEERNGDAVVTCTNDFVESDRPTSLMEPVVAQFRECVGSGWKIQRALSNGEGASVVVIYNELPVELELRFERERSGGADVMGLVTTAWTYRVSLKAFAPAKDASHPSLGARDTAAFCSTLKTLLAAAPDAFKDVKGQQMAERSWQPTHVLQGMQDCRVVQLRSGPTFYTCEVDFKGRSALAAAQRQLASESAACLGTEWRQGRRPYGDGVWNFSVGREGNGPKVGVRGESDEGKFTLNFDVVPR